MVYILLSHYENLNEGDLDGVFLLMKDMLCKLKKNNEHIDSIEKIKISTDKHKAEINLLDICYKCIYNGINPNVCRTILESMVQEMLNTKEIKNPTIMRMLTIVSMIPVLYTQDIDEFYSRASELCSPEVLREISSTSIFKNLYSSGRYSAFRYCMCECNPLSERVGKNASITLKANKV